MRKGSVRSANLETEIRKKKAPHTDDQSCKVKNTKKHSENPKNFLPRLRRDLAFDGCGWAGRARPLSGLIKFDPFDQSLPNYNTLVTGSSGSGKSFLNNCTLLQSLTQNPLVYIIDMGGSYRKLYEFMGGQYIEVTPPTGDEATSSINPFRLVDGATEPSPQKIKFLLSLLETMLSDDDAEKLPKLSKSLLEEAIISVYQQKEAATPTLSDLVEVLQKSGEVGLQNFAKMLYP